MKIKVDFRFVHRASTAVEFLGKEAEFRQNKGSLVPKWARLLDFLANWIRSLFLVSISRVWDSGFSPYFCS